MLLELNINHMNCTRMHVIIITRIITHTSGHQKNGKIATDKKLFPFINFNLVITLSAIAIVMFNKDEVSISKIKICRCSHFGIRNEES